MSLLAEGLRSHFSPAALARLQSARIGIAGAGGLGSNVAALLARSGIRRFVIADMDIVEPSNLNRQCFLPEDVGKPKVRALRERLLELDPEIECDSRQIRLEASTAPDLFAACEVVVEALDDPALKTALCSALLAAGLYVVAASGLAGYGMPPMRVRRMGDSFVCVGDFTSGVDDRTPPLAPRVMQAAALQADAVLEKILQTRKD